MAAVRGASARSVSSEQALVRLLQGNDGAFLSGSRLADRFGVTRAAIHKQILRLRSRGYRITGTNRVGYRLDPSPQGLDPSRITGPLGRPFLYYRVLPSTQEEAKRRALLGAPEGTLVLSDRQTAGRGRLGRKWVSPAGGLWFSLVLRPRLSPARVPALTLVAALDLARVVRRQARLRAGVKWPNDVWIGERKVAGVLSEMSSEMDRVNWVVIGVGVNVNNPVPRGTDVPATSLSLSSGRLVARQQILQQWLSSFQKNYATYLQRGFRPFRAAYERAFILKGQRVQVWEGNVRSTGRARGVDEEGRLELSGTGGRHFLAAGEIQRVRPGS